MRSLSSHEQLIVPIHDRRQGTRIVTLKNFGWFAAAVFILLLGVKLVTGLRHGTDEGEYGRLFGRQVGPSPAAVKAPVPVVTEGSGVQDVTAANPMLVAPMAREQYLHADETSPQPKTVIVPVPVAVQPATAPVPSGKVAIVGDGAGVSIVGQTTSTQPKLTGGFSRP